MLKLFRWRGILSLLLIMIIIGSCISVGCTSTSTSNQTGLPSSTPKITILTPTASPTGTQRIVSSQQPYISVASTPYQFRKGQDITFKGTVAGGATSLTLTIYFVCEDPMNCSNLGCERRGTCTYVNKVTVPVNADSTFSSLMSTTTFKVGEYRAYFELPTGQNTWWAFLIEP